MDLHTLPLLQAAFDQFVQHANTMLMEPTSWDSLELGGGTKFGRMLEALVLLTSSKSAPLATNTVLEGVTRWRAEHIRDRVVGKSLTSLQYAVELIFCTTALRLLGSPGCISELSQRLRDQLEEEISVRLLHSTLSEVDQHTSGSSSVPSHRQHFSRRRFFLQNICCTMGGGSEETCHLIEVQPDVPCSGSEAVSEMYSRILGVLSGGDMLTVTARFLPRLNTSISGGHNSRHEAVSMVYILRYVRLGIYSRQELKNSVGFLQKLSDVMELGHLPGELKHELCALFTACMERVPTKIAWESGMDFEAWDSVILRIFNKIKGSWTSKTKHILPACRALAALLGAFSRANGEDSTLATLHGPDLVNMLLKHCRDKALRGGMLICLRRILASRVYPTDKVASVDNLVLLMQKGVGQVVDTFREERADNFHDCERMIDFVVLLGTMTPSSLDFAMDFVVTPALQTSDDHGSDNIVLVLAFRTFVGICQVYEHEKYNTDQATRTRNSDWSGNSADTEPRLLNRLSRRVGSLMPVLLARCVADCKAASHSTGTDVQHKYAYQVAVAMLQCIPRAIPRMPRQDFQISVATLTLHTDADVRIAACAVMKRLLQLWPPLRAPIVSVTCDFLGMIAEREFSVLERAARQLCELVGEWAVLGDRVPLTEAAVSKTFHMISEEWAGEHQSHEDVRQCIAFVDSVALFLLCSTSIPVRRAALDLLQRTHDLQKRIGHTIVAEGIAEQKLTMLQIIGQVHIALPDQRELVLDGSIGAVQSFASHSSDGSADGNTIDQKNWSDCLGQLCLIIATLRPNIASLLRVFAVRSAARSVQRSMSADEASRAVLMWRNFAVAGICANRHTSGDSGQRSLTSEESTLKMLQHGNKEYRAAAVCALSYVRPSTFESLLSPLNLLIKKVTSVAEQKSKERKSRDGLFESLLSLYRSFSASLNPGSLGNTPLGQHFVFFIESTLTYFASGSSRKNLLWEVEALRADFCAFARHITKAAYSSEGRRSDLKTELRHRLFEQLCAWSGFGNEGKNQAHGN